MIISVLKILVISAEAVFELMLSAYSISELITSSYDSRPLSTAMLFLFLGSLMISIAEFVRIKRKKKWVLLPMHGMKATMFVLGISKYGFSDYRMTRDGDSLGAAVTLLLLAAMMVGAGYGIRYTAKKRTEQAQSGGGDPYQLAFYAEWYYPMVVPEYRRLHGLENAAPEVPPVRTARNTDDPACEHPLTPQQMDDVKIFACVPFAYLFAWLARRDGLSEHLLSELITIRTYPPDEMRQLLEPIRQGTGDPAVFLARRLNGRLLESDFAPGRMLDFLRSYCYISSYGKEAPTSLCEQDYQAIVMGDAETEQAPRWCRSFSWETYRRMETILDTRYDGYCRNAELDELELRAEKWYSNAFDMDLEVYTSVVGGGESEVFYRYVAECLKQIDAMPEALMAEICASLIQCWGEDWVGSLTPETLPGQLDCGEVDILKPCGDELAYILRFEAEFEPEHGISVMVRNGKVLSVGYRADACSPWAAGAANA